MEKETKTAYHSPLLAGHNKALTRAHAFVNRLLEIEDTAIIKPSIDNAGVDKGLTRVVSIVGETDEIPHIPYPHYHRGVVLVDARPYLNREGQIKIGSEFNFQLKLGKLEALWQDDPTQLLSSKFLIIDLWATWVTNELGRALNVPPNIHTSIKIVCAAYAIGLLYQGIDKPNSEIEILMLGLIPRATAIPSSLVTELMEDVPEYLKVIRLPEGPLAGFNDWIRLLLKVTNEDYAITDVTIYNSVTAGVIVNTAASIISGVGLVHIPAFTGMLDTSTERGIHGKTKLGQLVNRAHRKHNIESFSKSLSYIYSRY